MTSGPLRPRSTISLTSLYRRATRRLAGSTTVPQENYSLYVVAGNQFIIVTLEYNLVLPYLREKQDEFMLRELVKRFFHYLDRYFIARRSLTPLNEVGLTCFRDLIDQERKGEQIGRAMLKMILDAYHAGALKEAFEVFCNKGVAGSSSAELLATFCDNILKKGGSEKLSDEAIEETFEKSANDDHERSILTKKNYNVMVSSLQKWKEWYVSL
ncbi:hypothetical protein V2J09_021149 [Rumex salicifolius]